MKQKNRPSNHKTPDLEFSPQSPPKNNSKDIASQNPNTKRPNVQNQDEKIDISEGGVKTSSDNYGH